MMVPVIVAALAEIADLKVLLLGTGQVVLTEAHLKALLGCSRDRRCQ